MHTACTTFEPWSGRGKTQCPAFASDGVKALNWPGWSGSGALNPLQNANTTVSSLYRLRPSKKPREASVGAPFRRLRSLTGWLATINLAHGTEQCTPLIAQSASMKQSMVPSGPAQTARPNIDDDLISISDKHPSLKLCQSLLGGGQDRLWTM
ncbi:hypothetical protein ACLMJK_006400, partial [Lecanora helva]